MGTVSSKVVEFLSEKEPFAVPLAITEEGLISIISNERKTCYIVTPALEIKAKINLSECNIVV